MFENVMHLLKNILKYRDQGLLTISASAETERNELALSTVVHASNPRYSGGSDQEDHGLRPARAKKLIRLNLR
jgi:hypothetical protein